MSERIRSMARIIAFLIFALVIGTFVAIVCFLASQITPENIGRFIKAVREAAQ